MTDYRDTTTGHEYYDFELEDEFFEHLNFNFPPVEVLAYEFGVGDILRDIDPTAFDEEFRSWIDSRVENGELIDLEYETSLEEDYDDDFDLEEE